MKRNFNICTVADGATLAAMLRSLGSVHNSAEMVEIRADFIKGIKADDVQKLKKAVKARSIFTCRSVREGGRYVGSPAEQSKILDAAFSANFDYVDVAADSPLLSDTTDKRKKKLLLSFHDFKSTPSSIELMGRMERMRNYSPAVIKIATLVKSAKDIFTLIEVLKQKREDERLTLIGMGEAGRITRLLFPMLGSWLTYGTVGKETSPGILSVKELETVYEFLYK